ncbi:hypothetical protein CMUS01_07054 [Colletotrichum musicola]|uniref:Uncharacterized protein n=1 Tax=Colletotrichum musicola TaxID=2175873 RepID=A0A8H6KJE5_9PEZI|nr:hypothetical protein CMUS01_07054 [Colletotrichum musicola]
MPHHRPQILLERIGLDNYALYPPALGINSNKQEQTPLRLLYAPSKMGAGSRNFIITAVVAWAFIGAVGYGDPALFESDDIRGTIALLLSLLIFLCLLCSADYSNAPAGRYYVPIITAFGCTTVLSCVATGWANEQCRLFWCQSGIFIGLVLEKATGLYERHVWRPSLEKQAATARAGREEMIRREEMI